MQAMQVIVPVETGSRTLQIGIGFASHQDAIWAAVRATAMARSGLHGTSPDLVLLVTAGVPAQDVVPMIRGVLGPVGVAGGATSAILTHNGAVTAGALVVCLTNGEGAESGPRQGRARPGSSWRDGPSGCAILGAAVSRS